MSSVHCDLLHCLPVIYRATAATNLISGMTSPFHCDIFIILQCKNGICERLDNCLIINTQVLQFFQVITRLYCFGNSSKFRSVEIGLDRTTLLKSGNNVCVPETGAGGRTKQQYLLTAEVVSNNTDILVSIFLPSLLV
jgi:hypothetical protein